MAANPVADPQGGCPVNGLGAPGSGVDMAVAASLVALATDIQLERLERGSPQCQPVSRQLFTEDILGVRSHGNRSTPRGRKLWPEESERVDLPKVHCHKAVALRGPG